MQGNAGIKSVATVIIFTLLFTFTIQAQDRHRVRPAFPIASGEKMLVIPGAAFRKDPALPNTSYVYGSELDVNYYHIVLPVGTTLKRMVVEAADSDGSDATYLRFRLFRFENIGIGRIPLRDITTQGYDSSLPKQFVSNPMNHTMLQGWTYYVQIISQGGPSSSHTIGVIKIIYEP